MFDVRRFQREWNESFSYSFVAREELSAAEAAIFDLTDRAAALAGVDLQQRGITVAISETTRLSDRGAEVVGVWEPGERRIVVRRDRLADPTSFLGTFLHELTHAMWGFPDLTFEFEESLTTQLGSVAGRGLLPHDPDHGRA
jgi:hypothetical protein